MRLAFLDKLESMRPFTEKEAWNLFRITALGEAFGWTLLITGIVINHFKWPLYRYAIPIAGQVHGVIFVAYFGVLIATYSSLRWPRKRFIAGVLAGIPPYGTLVFEMWAAHIRRKALRGTYRQATVRAIIADKQTILAIQPGHGIAWKLPGDYVEAGETPDAAIVRVIQTMTGVMPTLDSLKYIVQSRDHRAEYLEFFFIVTNVSDFKKVDFQHVLKRNLSIDDMRFIKPHETPDLEPIILQKEPLSVITKPSNNTRNLFL